MTALRHETHEFLVFLYWIVTGRFA